MTDSVALTDEQLFEVTHKVRPSAQCRALSRMGITHKRRPDGSVHVDRQHYDNLLGVVANAKVSRRQRAEINWG